jgi:hypothetical protein
MFKAGTVVGLTSAQSLVHDTQKDVNKEDTTDHKEKNRTARKLLGEHHPRVVPLRRTGPSSLPCPSSSNRACRRSP